jgi:glyoxylase-like metal-dependent hydrolase (beta-lactamase superfamily II)
MGEGEATWPATAVSLISGERDAVLIDTALTPQDAGQVVDWIRATRKNLTTIYITHGHGDHFFGLNTILDAFPNASAVTAAAVVPDARTQLSPELMGFWNAIFPGQIPEHPILPDALDGDVLDLEGQKLPIITVGQADTYPSTIVYVPSLAAVIAGDVAYNGITSGWSGPTTTSECSGSPASTSSRRSSPRSSSPATSAPTHAMTTRPPFWATPRPTFATSTSRLPRAIQPRSWSTR